ncbi:MAG: hypothetical protein IPI95_01960 [Flavobacteriales bacterium]|nr:hypothetical protein [Flavobacteriales bacterium]
MKYLPYAIAFKVEKIWGDRFQDMIGKALIDKSYHPGWYSGSITNWRVLTAYELLTFQQCPVLEHTAFQQQGFGGGRFSGSGGGGGSGGGW